MAAKRAKKPSPVPVSTVCDLCGLPWGLHGSEPTTDDCIRLLKVELAKKPTPYIQPYPAYIEKPYWPKAVPYWRQPIIISKSEVPVGGMRMWEGGTTKLIESGANVTINQTGAENG